MEISYQLVSQDIFIHPFLLSFLIFFARIILQIFLQVLKRKLKKQDLTGLYHHLIPVFLLQPKRVLHNKANDFEQQSK